MRRDDYLAVIVFLHAPQQLHEFDLPRRRQRRFRLVEDKEALPARAFVEEAQKSLAVRMRQKIRWRPGADRRGVEIARDGEKTFRAKEPAAGDFRQPLRPKGLGERATALVDRLRMIDRTITITAARFVKAGENRDALQQSRFAHPTFAHDNGHRFFTA